jgi:feruloyl esterase
MWNQKALSEAPVTPAKLTLLADKVMAKCDAVDGLKDGLIDDPRKCAFDPGREVPACSPGTEPDCLTRPGGGNCHVYTGLVSNGKPFFPIFCAKPDAESFRRRQQRLDEHDRKRAAQRQAR